MNSVVLKIRSLAASERKITAEVLECIREVEKKGIHLGMGYPNLVVFLVKECCYSETAALRRIAAARLVDEIPKMGEELRDGNLSLSHVSIVAQGVRQKEKEGGEVSTGVKEEILDAVMGKSSVEAQKITAQVLDLPKIVKDKVIVHGDDTQTLQMNFSKEELELFERAKEVMGHIQPGMSKKEVVVEGLKMILKYRDPARKVRQRATATVLKSVKKEGLSGSEGETSVESLNTKKSNKTSDQGQVSASNRETQGSNQNSSFVGTMDGDNFLRNKGGIKWRQGKVAISAQVRREIFQRDQCCQWKDANGRICGTKHLLEVDHVRPRWAGGGNEIGNLRLLCRAHNQFRNLECGS